MFTPVPAAPHPSGLSQQIRKQVVKQSQNESHSVAVRLTSFERADVAALAAIEGKAISTYIRDMLTAASTRSRPTLAASGALLAICDTLQDLATSTEMDPASRDLISRQALLVIGIVRLHDTEFTS